MTYTFIGAIIYFAANQFEVSKLIQGNGEKLTGFVMIFIGLIMLEVIKINFWNSIGIKDRLTEKF